MFVNRLPVVAALIVPIFSGCAQQNKAMKHQQETDPWVVRTEFSDEKQWLKIRDLISAEQIDGKQKFFAHVKFVSHEDYRDKAPRNIVKSLPDNYRGHFCFVIDRASVLNQDHVVLVVGFYPSDQKSFHRLPRDTPTSDIKTFRALPSQIQAIENNLSIANMDFEEFANAVDKDGVFKGFR